MSQLDWRREIYRCSRLDEYRKYLAGELFDGSEYSTADFIDRMTSRQTSRAMEAGAAVHKLIENAGFGELPEHAECEGWKIHFDLDATLPMPKGREIELSRTHKGITLYGKVDGMDLHTVHDTKTTASIDIDRYMDSFQWRGYLYLSGRKNFVYDIFKVKVEDDVNLVIVQDYVALKVSAYPNMARDVETLLEDFDACMKTLAIPEIMLKKMALAA